MKKNKLYTWQTKSQVMRFTTKNSMMRRINLSPQGSPLSIRPCFQWMLPFQKRPNSSLVGKLYVFKQFLCQQTLSSEQRRPYYPDWL